MRDYYEEICSKCKYKDVDEHDSPCKECIDAFFDDCKNPKRKLGKYFVKVKNDVKGQTKGRKDVQSERRNK